MITIITSQLTNKIHLLIITTKYTYTHIQNIPVNKSLKASGGIWLSMFVMSCSSKRRDAWFANSTGSKDAIANTSSDTSSTASKNKQQ